MRENLHLAMTEPTEQLMDCCKQSDTDAFRQIVKRHQGYAFALAFRILCESEDAKDVVQESFIRVWTHRAEYHADVKFTTWLYKIVVNLCYDRLRAKQRREKMFLRQDDRMGEPTEMHSDNPEELAVNRDLAERILHLAAKLPEKQRIVFTLRDIHDQTIEEVAAIVGISPESVRTNLCYARAAIRTRLEGMRKE